MKQFKIISIDEHSAEWHTWRTQGVGSSDASVIMEQNPWKKLPVLIAEKRTGEWASPKSKAMKRGLRLEPIAREEYCEFAGHEVSPVCIQQIEHPWLRASLDGITKDENLIVEIKCGKAAHKYVKSEGNPPSYSYTQLQHIMMVSGFEEIDYWSYRKQGVGCLLKVLRDEAFIGELFQKEKSFWESYISNSLSPS